MKKSNEKRIGEKIRLLSLFSNKEKLKLSELKEIIGMDMESIQNELLECTTIGYYPYSPLELIDVEIRTENIEVHIPISVKKALNLNIQEWLKLRDIILNEKQNNPTNRSKELDSILKKIEKIIPSSHYQDFFTLKEKLSDAMVENYIIIFSYQKRGKKLEERTVLPLFIFEETGHYLAGYCTVSKSLRTFRLDRIVNLKVTDKRFEYSQDEDEKKKFIEKFKEFKNQSASSSEIASIIIHRSAFFNLSRLIVLQKVVRGLDKFSDYFYADTPIIEEVWFMEIIKSFGKSVLIDKPSVLKEKILYDLDSIKVPDYKT